MAASLVRFVDPPELGKTNPVYSGLTIVPIGDACDLVTISGQIAVTPSGDVPDTFEEQLEVCLARFETCLAAAGATVHDLIRFNYGVVEHEEGTTPSLIIKRVAEFLRGHKPASTYYVVRSLSKAEYKLEFDGMAVVRRQWRAES